MASAIPNIKLSDGTKMPIFGLGTWKSKPEKVKQAVIDAIDMGYRHIDCAFAYENEKEIGEALKAKFDDRTVKREDIFITSKLWSTFHPRDYVKKCLQQTLDALGVEYVDLYLIHWPMAYKEDTELFPKGDDGKLIASDVDYMDSWKGMEDCQKAGLIRSLGLSNFNSEQVQRVIDNSEIKPVMNQVECHPYLNQKNLLAFCKARGVELTAYSPLGSPDRPWVTPEDPNMMDDPELIQIGANHGKTAAQVLIRYQVQRGIVCIPKSVTKKRIEGNMNVFDFELTQDEMNKLDSFDRDGRVCRLEWAKDLKYYPFNIPY